MDLATKPVKPVNLKVLVLAEAVYCKFMAYLETLSDLVK
jgi:hypothetical protein